MMNTLLAEEIKRCIDSAVADSVMLVTDSNVAVIERDLIEALAPQDTVVIPAGEGNKNIREVERVLSMLSRGGATRRSLLVCVGGGMVTDLGGFAAAIFKRGIRHINVATTLLGAVDASVGGKTGVDFLGLKNEVGAFHLPIKVFADTRSFASLPPREILSGFGEVVKTAFIAGPDEARRVLEMRPLEADAATLDEVCRFCRAEKMRIVEADPTEKGLRKVLNLGHTAGHAIESVMLTKGRAVPHGVAVAHGLLIALILGNSIAALDSAWVTAYARWLRNNYPVLPVTCRDYRELWDMACHDKKNLSGSQPNFVLLSSPGNPVMDVGVERREFDAALDLYQELTGR